MHAVMHPWERAGHLNVPDAITSDDGILPASNRALENEVVVEFSIRHGYHSDSRSGFADVLEVTSKHVTVVALKPCRIIFREGGEGGIGMVVNLIGVIGAAG